MKIETIAVFVVFLFFVFVSAASAFESVFVSVFASAFVFRSFFVFIFCYQLFINHEGHKGLHKGRKVLITNTLCPLWLKNFVLK